MPCKKCQEMRQDLRKAVVSRDVKKSVQISVKGANHLLRSKMGRRRVTRANSQNSS